MSVLDWSVYIVSGVFLALSVLNLLVTPAVMGRAKEGKWGYPDFVRAVLSTGMVVLMTGRVFGWW